MFCIDPCMCSVNIYIPLWPTALGKIHIDRVIHGSIKPNSDDLKTVVNVARSNPFSVYCNNDDMNVCCNMIMNIWCNSISGELRSNITVLRDIIDIRDGMNECDSLCIDIVLFIIDDICID